MKTPMMKIVEKVEKNSEEKQENNDESTVSSKLPVNEKKRVRAYTDDIHNNSTKDDDDVFDFFMFKPMSTSKKKISKPAMDNINHDGIEEEENEEKEEN